MFFVWGICTVWIPQLFTIEIQHRRPKYIPKCRKFKRPHAAGFVLNKRIWQREAVWISKIVFFESIKFLSVRNYHHSYVDKWTSYNQITYYIIDSEPVFVENSNSTHQDLNFTLTSSVFSFHSRRHVTDGNNMFTTT